MKSISRKEYLANTNICPRCSSENITADTISFQFGWGEQGVSCVDCGLSWTDVLQVVDIISVCDMASENEDELEVIE